jgi:hypothetical protein
MKLLRGLIAGPNPAAVVEDAPGRSNLALTRRREQIDGELRAHLYLYDRRKFIIASVMSVPRSLILEIDDVTVLDASITNEVLGQTVCAHLLRFVRKEPPNQRNAKRTDWPAFRASGARSVIGFEEKAWRAHVETVGPLVLDITAAPARTNQPYLQIKSIASAEHGGLGARVRDAIHAAEALRAAGVF